MSVKEKKEIDQSYLAIVKRQFNKNKAAVWSLRIVGFIFILGMFSSFIANDKPYYCKINGKTYFPIFNSIGKDLGITNTPKELNNTTWRELKYESVIWPLIPYLPQTIDYKNTNYASPFKEQNVASKKWFHYLGTDQLGRDVLAGMIHGTKVAMLVGVISMSISFIIGIFVGSVAGYYGDTKLKLKRGTIILNILFIFFAFFYAFSARSFELKNAFSSSIFMYLVQLLISLFIFLAVMVIPNLLAVLINKIGFLNKEISIPVDIIVSRFIEIFQSIPTTLLILSVVALIEKPSIYYVMVIIGFTGWTGIARYIRGELLKVRSLEYIEAAQALGFSEFRIMLKHAIPNALTSVLIAVAFGISSAILVESGLSFLGIGLGAEEVTWGSLLNTARGDVSSWWMAIVPGFAIFITVTVFNLIGDGLTDAMDPRLKQ